MMMSCVGFEVYKFSELPLLAQQFFQSPPFGCLKIFGAPPQYLHSPPPPLVILNELSLISGLFSLSCARFSKIFQRPSRSPARISIKFIYFPFARNSLYCLITIFTYSSRNATGKVMSRCLTENFIILALWKHLKERPLDSRTRTNTSTRFD